MSGSGASTGFAGAAPLSLPVTVATLSPLVDVCVATTGAPGASKGSWRGSATGTTGATGGAATGAAGAATAGDGAGAAGVAGADVEVDVAPITRELAARVADNARDLGAQGFARWALGLPWREFCAVVQLCSGHTRRTLEAA